MSRDFDNYQRGGLYGHGRFSAVPLSLAMRRVDTEITRALGIPNVLRLGGGDTGIGRHKQGLAVDYQAGKPNDEVHGEIASYALDKDNWLRHNGRYLAFGGWEYIAPYKGAMWVRRVQPWYGGSDPWHTNHVHYDLWDAGPNEADPNIGLGSWRSSKGNVNPGASVEQVRRAQQLLTELTLYGGVVGGGLGSLTRAAVTDYQKAVGLTPDGVPGPKTIAHMEELVMSIKSDLAKIKTALEETQKNSRASLEKSDRAIAIVTQNQREIRSLHTQVLPSENGSTLHSKVMKLSDAGGRVDGAVKDILARLEGIESVLSAPDDASTLLAEFDANAEA